MWLKRLLCHLRGHPERFYEWPDAKCVQTDHGEWLVWGEVRCWCGFVKFGEGAVRNPENRSTDSEETSDSTADPTAQGPS